MRSLPYIAGLLALSLVAIAVVMRLLPVRAEDYHVDPATVVPPSSPNFALARGDTAPSHLGDLSETAEILTRAIAAEGGTLLAGDLADGHASFVFRSRLMGFPDIVSIRLRDATQGGTVRLPDDTQLTEVDIFSRSIYGYGDMGVNRARVNRLIEPLAP